MAELAKKITVDMKRKKVLINGFEFPWYISEDGVDVDNLLDPNEIATVGFRILADSVEVIPADG